MKKLWQIVPVSPGNDNAIIYENLSLFSTISIHFSSSDRRIVARLMNVS